jgi:hypothetical protein
MNSPVFLILSLVMGVFATSDGIVAGMVYSDNATPKLTVMGAWEVLFGPIMKMPKEWYRSAQKRLEDK